MSVFDTRKHCNVARRAEYRRIRRNFKGLEKYKEEKLRRRRVLFLRGLGLGVGVVAQRLGVSESTVKRDLLKMRRYLKGEFNRVAFEECGRTFDEFNSLSLKGQVDYVRRLRECALASRKAISCSGLVVTVDFDAALAGRYALRFKPDLPVELVENARITLELLVCGRRQVLGRMYMGQIGQGLAGLQTNQSLNVFVKCVLEGLRVVEFSVGSPVEPCFW